MWTHGHYEAVSLDLKQEIGLKPPTILIVRFEARHTYFNGLRLEWPKENFRSQVSYILPVAEARVGTSFTRYSDP
jgi:hypothetical protein